MRSDLHEGDTEKEGSQHLNYTEWPHCVKVGRKATTETSLLLGILSGFISKE